MSIPSLRKRIGMIALLIGFTSLTAEAQTNLIAVRGNVYDRVTKAPLYGVNVLVENSSNGTVTDSLGNFVIYLNPGHYELRFDYVGYKAKSLDIHVDREVGPSAMEVGLAQSAYTASEVVVKADRFTTSPSIYMVREKDLKYMPNLFSDVLRSVTILPGVSSNNELTSTYNVNGQNFNDNLIYLDGFEIYQPYLVQKGIQESESLINEHMVRNFKFYNAAFPVQYGDKMSSVLEVNYRNNEDSVLGGEVNAGLLNTGITLHDRIGRLNWIAGFRYAYPTSFTGVLQTKGSYIPRYSDFQLFGSYTFPRKIRMDLLFITARNSFNLTPQDWTGNFQYGEWFNFQQILLRFNGGNNYTYSSNLLGLRLTSPLDSHSTISTSLGLYSDRETYNENLTSSVYYVPDAYDPQAMNFLESGYNFANDFLLMNRIEFKADYVSNYGTHKTIAGISVKSSGMNNSLDELTSYTGLTGPPQLAISKQNYVFNTVSSYLSEEMELTHGVNVNVGIRALKDYFNSQFLLSPRASALFQPNATNSISLGWGYYYQPPSFYETRDKSTAVARNLMAQKAIHYVLRYENTLHDNSNLMAEVFYEKLSDLIPYTFTNQLQLSYGDSNNYEGYAYGLDLEYEGKLSEGMDTYIGYDYLNAQQRNIAPGSAYQRSLLDQTSTIQVFLQDAMPQLRNSEAHVRLLFGTGYLYHPMIDAPGTSPTNNPQMVTDFTQVQVYPWYYRVDMGLTYKLPLASATNLVLTADVFNVFDNRNVVTYSWYFIPQESPQPVPIPDLLSTRYFNVGARVDF